MRFGCVTAEIGRIPRMAEMGYDFVELSFRALAPLEDDETFATTRQRIIEGPLRPEALSGFIPPFMNLSVVGPNTDRAKLRRYCEMMLTRASDLGGKIAVFGSGGARNVPEGFSREKALDQLRDFLAIMADAATARGMTAVLEVLNRGETNLINTHEEALSVIRSINKPGLKAIVDYYHLMSDNLPLSGVEDSGEILVHAHTSDANRQPPGTSGPSQRPFLEALRSNGYDTRVGAGRLSIECRFSDFDTEAKAALDHLRELWAEVDRGA